MVSLEEINPLEFSFKYVYVGEEEIIRAFRERKDLRDFDVYANWLGMESARLKSRR